jgi:hypothetical protein
VGRRFLSNCCSVRERYPFLFTVTWRSEKFGLSVTTIPCIISNTLALELGSNAKTFENISCCSGYCDSFVTHHRRDKFNSQPPLIPPSLPLFHCPRTANFIATLPRSFLTAHHRPLFIQLRPCRTYRTLLCRAARYRPLTRVWAVGRPINQGVGRHTIIEVSTTGEGVCPSLTASRSEHPVRLVLRRTHDVGTCAV